MTTNEFFAKQIAHMSTLAIENALDYFAELIAHEGGLGADERVRYDMLAQALSGRADRSHSGEQDQAIAEWFSRFYSEERPQRDMAAARRRQTELYPTD